jgi:hypothetical protein
VYTVTAEGKKVLEAEADAVRRIWARASAWDDWGDAFSPGAMEVMGPAMRLARVAFQAASRGDAGQVEKVRVVLSKAAEEIEKMAAGTSSGPQKNG